MIRLGNRLAWRKITWKILVVTLKKIIYCNRRIRSVKRYPPKQRYFQIRLHWQRRKTFIWNCSWTRWVGVWDGCFVGLVDRQTNRQTDAVMDRWTEGWMDGGRKDGLVDGWRDGWLPTSVRIFTVSGIGTNPLCLGLPVDFPSVNIINAFGTLGRSPPLSENNFSFANVSAKSILVWYSSFNGIFFIAFLNWSSVW